MNISASSTTAVFILFVLFLLSNIVAIPADLQDLPIQDDDWSELNQKALSELIPSVSNDRLERYQRLRRWLRASPPEIFDSWTHQWPTIHLDYGGQHPFENRELQSTSSSSYQPIRFSFITNQLEAQLNQTSAIDTKIQYILTTILPEVERIWSSHLSVIPTTQNIPIDNSVCFDLFNGMIPNDILQNGISADLVIIASAIDVITFSDGTQDVFCSANDGKLAFAVLCAREQFDRPAIGFINFCLNATTAVQGRRQLLTKEEEEEEETERDVTEEREEDATEEQDSQRHRRDTGVNNQDEVLVALHEIGHVLGMSSQSFPYFRNATTGEPLTPRPFANQTVTCIYNHTQTDIFPASNTVQMGITDKGIIYYDVVTPRVQQVTRNHFNCQNLTGARLEDQDTNPTDCTGSHWSERLHFGELMEAKVLLGAAEILSPLTLALMEDTGWYQVNYANAKLLPYGLGAGCDFVNHDCIVNDQVPDYGQGYFCNYTTPVQSNGVLSGNSSLFCDPTHYEWAVCALFDIQQTPTAFVQSLVTSLPSVRYFSDSNLVGLFPQGEFCPMPVIPIGIDCTDSSTQMGTMYQGETYSSTSRCIDAFFYNSQLNANMNRPGCFEVQCDPSAFQVTVNGHVCTYDFEESSIPTVDGTSATIICPRLSTLCPDLYCPSDCSGRGICDHSTSPPTCQCFDSSDATSSCNATLGSSPPSAPSTPVPSPSGTGQPLSPNGGSTLSPTLTKAPARSNGGPFSSPATQPTFLSQAPNTLTGLIPTVAPAPTKKPSILSFVLSAGPPGIVLSMACWIPMVVAWVVAVV
jgi:hypothetical protein